MLKKILFIALCCIPAALSAQVTETTEQKKEFQTVEKTTERAQPLFGYLSYNQLFKAMPDYTLAQESLNILKSKYDAELKRADEEFYKKYSEFLQDQKNFPPTILMRRQKELQELMEKSIRFKDEVKKLMAEAQQEMTEPIKTKLNEAIARVATLHGLDYVINTDSNSYPYLNPERGIDITKEVKIRVGISE